MKKNFIGVIVALVFSYLGYLMSIPTLIYNTSVGLGGFFAIMLGSFFAAPIQVLSAISLYAFAGLFPVITYHVFTGTKKQYLTQPS